MSLQGQLHPRFDAESWLPFNMAQVTVKWFIVISTVHHTCTLSDMYLYAHVGSHL
jgi:hypothetical protein